MKRNWLQSFFVTISETIIGSEKSLLDLLSAFVPWCVPVIPAYLTYFHTADPKMLNFPTWVAWTAAFVVEVLGLASVSTAIRFYRNNQRYSKVENQAPFKLAVFIYVFYLAITLTVNVLLEFVSGQRSGVIIWAIALFMLLGIPSGVLISIRTQFGEMLEEREYKKAVAKGDTLQPTQQKFGFSPMANTLKVKYASDYHDKILAYLDTHYESKGEVLMPKDITTKFNLNHTNNKGYVSLLTKEWKQSKGIE